MQARAITALVTPFNEKGNIDFEALDKLIDFQREGGSEGILLCGSTGEGSLLTREEKLAIFHRAVEQAKGSIEIIANVGGCSTQKSIDLAKDAENLGVDAAAAIVPYYVKPSDEGCLRHFQAIASVGLPLIVYHHPGRTGTRLSLKTLVEITSIDGVIGIKEASGDLDLTLDLIQEGVSIYSGDDLLCLKHMQQGAQGSISICGNIIPSLWKGVIKTQTMTKEIENLCRSLVLESNPQCVKYAASLLGLCSSSLRLPLIEPRKTSKQRVEGALLFLGSVLT